MDDSAEQYDATRYAFKPSLVGVPSEFILDDAGIEWRSGARTVRVLFRDIKQIRLLYRPVSLQSYRFVAEVKSRTGIKFTIASTSWRSLVEHQSHGPQYKAFIAELHRRVAATGSPVNYIAGSPAFLYWLGLLVFSGLMLAAASLAFRAVQGGEWQATAFIVAMLGFFLWQTGTFFRRNRPGTYAPDQLPEQVLP